MNILAEVVGADAQNTLLIFATAGSVVVSAIAIFRTVSGKDGERQIEPTQIHALRESIAEQTKALSENSRELGILHRSVDILTDNLTEMRGKQERELGKVHNRIDGISEKVAKHGEAIETLQRTVEAAR